MAGAPWVHATAEVEPGANVGSGTRVWRHAHIRAGAVVGADCTIAARVYVDSGARIGNRVKVQDNVSIYNGVDIEDDVLVGPAAVFTNDRYPRAQGAWAPIPTRVRRGASVGANATLVCGVEVGEGALVAAGAVVTRDVAPFELVAGNPARRRGWVCVCGRVVAHTAGDRPSSWRCAHCGRSEGDTQRSISLHHVEVAPTTERLVLNVLRSGRLARGPMVAQFEQAWAERVGVRHAVAVTSGTSALLLALRACGVGPGDEVVTTPVTFAATLSTILEVGATAVFADVDPDGTISPAAVAGALTDRTQAILPVHLYGLPADVPALASVAMDRGVRLVEDAAQAAGASVAGRAVGAFGVGCFSFYATKNLSTGEGGMVTTDDDELAERLRMLGDHGRGPTGDHEILGHNYRMTDVQAAIGLGQLAVLDDQNRRRRENALRLTEGLSGVAGLALPGDVGDRRHAYSLYTVRVTADARLTRDELADRLRGCGVETGIYYRRLVFDHPAFTGRPGVVPGHVPEAEALVGEALSLPVHPHLTRSDVDTVVRRLREFLD